MPLGRVINRFSSDIQQIDCNIPENLYNVYSDFLYIIATLIGIAVVRAWFALVIPISIGLQLLVQVSYILFVTGIKKRSYVFFDTAMT